MVNQLLSAGLPMGTVAAIEAAVGAAVMKDQQTQVPAPGFAAMRCNGARSSAMSDVSVRSRGK